MSAHYFGKDWAVADTRTPVRILVVDDSAVMRAWIDGIFRDYPGIEIAAKVATAAQAFDYLAGHPVDIILLDHEMPGQKGVEALPHMLALARGAHVVLLSSFGERGSELSVKALSLGASDVIRKPTRHQATPAFAVSLIERFTRLTAARQQSPGPEEQGGLRTFPDDFRLGCIGIGASTGGIHSLGTVLAGLRRRPGVPVLVTQHLPDAFIPYYARQVAGMTDLPVTVARQDMVLEPDHIYIAPGDRSLTCRPVAGRACIDLNPARDPATRTRPSVNAMFAGMAACFGAGAFGVVLTGIGRDGTAGAKQIVAAGGAIITQDRASSTVWGMPGSAARAGLSCAVLPPAAMMDYLFHRAGGEET
ncbi:MAG: chemotaxis protein CheB [Sphingobium sp.]